MTATMPLTRKRQPGMKNEPAARRLKRDQNYLAGRQFVGAFHGSSLDAHSGSAWDSRGASANTHVR